MTEPNPPSLRRAIAFTTGSSLAVPVVGLLTQPALAQALGVEGRGQVAAAVAPAALIVAVATLGLPEAITHLLARSPRSTRKAVVIASVLSASLAGTCAVITWLTLPFLSSGDETLSKYIMIGVLAAAPTLVVGALRGAASGLQQWGKVATERLLGTSFRLVSIMLLWAVGELSVLYAVVISVISPFLGGVVYLSLLWRDNSTRKQSTGDRPGKVAVTLISFGSKIWIGAVAEMFLGRVGQVLMAPLSSVRELGLYSVASTIADVPLIVTLAVQSAVFGVSSKAPDAIRLCAVSRICLLLGGFGCLLIGATLPFWIGPLFGSEFTAASLPTVLILLSVIFCIPGLLAASGLAAWGRPALRSIGLGVTLILYLALFPLLVPLLGVYGACTCSLVANVAMTSFMTLAAAHVLGVRASSFFLIKGSDFRHLTQEARRLKARRSARD